MSSRRHFLKGTLTGLALLAVRPGGAAARTYTNPVVARDFPDPFVLRHEGKYYAFGTTGRHRTPDGRVFAVLTSTNLVDWQPAAGALTPPAGSDEADFWAPEVVLHAGTFTCIIRGAAGPSRPPWGTSCTWPPAPGPRGPTPK